MLTPLIFATLLLANAPAPTKPAGAIVAKPGAAASGEIMETIALRYVPAGDIEQLLTGQTGSHIGTPRSSGLMPLTVRAWSVDSSRNTLTLIGDHEGIDAVKQIIRLVDVSPRRLTIEVRLVRLEGAVDPQGPILRPVEEAELGAIEARPSFRAWTLPATNNHRVSFRAQLGLVGRGDVQQITPRINGDGSITLIVGVPPTSAASAGNPPTKNLDDLDLKPVAVAGVDTNLEGLLALRRVPSGRAMAVEFPREGVALLIRPTLLPDSPALEQGK